MVLKWHKSRECRAVWVWRFVETYFFPWRNSPTGPVSPHYRDFTTTMGRIPLDEWSARRRDIYLTTNNYYDRHPCHRRVSNPAIPASERPQTDALDRAATGKGLPLYYLFQIRNHPTGDLSRVVWVFMFKIQNGSEILWAVCVLKFIFTEVTLKANNSLHVWYDVV